MICVGSLINLKYIQQNPKSPIKLDFFLKTFNNLIPELFYDVSEKISVMSKINLDSRNLNGSNESIVWYPFNRWQSRDNFGETWFLPVNKLQSIDSSGKKNKDFVPFIHDMAISSKIELIEEFFGSCESKIAILKITEVSSKEDRVNRIARAIEETINGGIAPSVKNQRKLVHERLAKAICSNNTLWDSLQFLIYIGTPDIYLQDILLFNSTTNKFSHLKEILFQAKKIEDFESLLDWLSKSNMSAIQEGYPMLSRFGISITETFDSVVNNRTYVEHFQDYVSVKATKDCNIYYCNGSDQMARKSRWYRITK